MIKALPLFRLVSVILASAVIFSGCQTTGSDAETMRPKKKAMVSTQANQDYNTFEQAPAITDEVDTFGEEELGTESDTWSKSAITFAPIYFNYDESNLSEDAQANLLEIAERLKSDGSIVVQIQGHCDERGTTEYNLALGERRALVVQKYLETLGVSVGQMRTISYGEEFPASEERNEKGWAANRRAEFKTDLLTH